MSVPRAPPDLWAALCLTQPSCWSFRLLSLTHLFLSWHWVGREPGSGSREPLSCRVDGRDVHTTIPETGLTHRIKALFENALRSDSGSQCPLLWRMYLNFLVRKCFVFLFFRRALPLPHQ